MDRFIRLLAPRVLLYRVHSVKLATRCVSALVHWPELPLRCVFVVKFPGSRRELSVQLLRCVPRSFLSLKFALLTSLRMFFDVEFCRESFPLMCNESFPGITLNVGMQECCSTDSIVLYVLAGLVLRQRKKVPCVSVSVDAGCSR